jgi:hypothetical protein
MKLRAPKLPEKSGSCSASVKIQGVLWKCEDPDRTTTQVGQFRKELIQNGREECAKFCKKLGPCESRFEAPLHCGLETDRKSALKMGKEFGCRKECEGPAFAYCALYDTGFQSENAELLAQQEPNCHCFDKGLRLPGS